MVPHQTAIRVRTYGTSGPPLVVLHGGPGAPGYMAPVARGLAGSFRVLELIQRGSGGEPLTVARHVADLHALLESLAQERRPALVGHSWGAMLALAYAAAHPGHAAALALIGCGTFDPAARERLQVIRDTRIDDSLRRRLERLPEEVPDPDQRLWVLGNLMQRVDSYQLVPGEDEMLPCDARAHQETWDDMLRLQQAGVYPAAFSEIDVPVLMLHGTHDPHPGRMIQASLEPHLPQLEYVEWAHCGHYPWLERAVQDEFFSVLRGWLARHLTGRSRTLA